MLAINETKPMLRRATRQSLTVPYALSLDLKAAVDPIAQLMRKTNGTLSLGSKKLVCFEIHLTAAGPVLTDLGSHNKVYQQALYLNDHYGLPSRWLEGVEVAYFDRMLLAHLWQQNQSPMVAQTLRLDTSEEGIQGINESFGIYSITMLELLNSDDRAELVLKSGDRIRVGASYTRGWQLAVKEVMSTRLPAIIQARAIPSLWTLPFYVNSNHDITEVNVTCMVRVFVDPSSAQPVAGIAYFETPNGLCGTAPLTF